MESLLNLAHTEPITIIFDHSLRHGKNSISTENWTRTNVKVRDKVNGRVRKRENSLPPRAFTECQFSTAARRIAPAACVVCRWKSEAQVTRQQRRRTGHPVAVSCDSAASIPYNDNHAQSRMAKECASGRCGGWTSRGSTSTSTFALSMRHAARTPAIRRLPMAS